MLVEDDDHVEQRLVVETVEINARCWLDGARASDQWAYELPDQVRQGVYSVGVQISAGWILK